MGRHVGKPSWESAQRWLHRGDKSCFARRRKAWIDLPHDFAGIDGFEGPPGFEDALLACARRGVFRTGRQAGLRSGRRPGLRHPGWGYLSRWRAHILGRSRRLCRGLTRRRVLQLRRWRGADGSGPVPEQSGDDRESPNAQESNRDGGEDHRHGCDRGPQLDVTSHQRFADLTLTSRTGFLS
jgi:hypothetical protein